MKGWGMARINIEDSIYKDSRFIKLVLKTGDLEKALGALVRAWTIAQKWYLSPHRMIPKKVWYDSEINPHILEVGLAEIIDDFVRVRGADEQFVWLKQRQDAGRVNIKEFNNGRQSVVDGRSSSYSSSFSKKEKNMCDSGESHPHEFAYEEIYKAYPKRLGSMNKAAGINKLKRLIKTQADFDDALNAVMRYNQFCIETKKIKTELVKMFSSFFDSNGDWREWLNYKKAQSSKPTMDFKREY